MTELTVQVCTHHFVVRRVQARAKAAVENFARRYILWGWERERGRSFRAPKCVFAAATKDRNEYRFHINTLEQFKEHLERNWIKDDMIEWETRPMFEPRRVELPIFPQWETRDYQQPVVEYLTKVGKPISRFVDLQTGKGKSYCALRAATDLGVLVCLIIPPKYIEKWIIDLRKTYDIAHDEVMLVQGSAQIQALLMMVENGLMDNVKVIILSSKTMQNWIKLYEQFGDSILDMGYPCLPHQFFEFVGIGHRIIDEVHENFHLNFKIDLYTHCPWSSSLSATLISDDPFLQEMQKVAYPPAERYQGPAYDKYIDARAVFYRFKLPNKIRTKERGNNSYSHHAFEKSLMKYPDMLRNYMQLIDFVIKGSYLRNYKKGQKLLIYGASIDFCTRLTQYLKQVYPDMDVRRYCEDDPYENLMEPDIRVSTLQSAGTGVDIPDLTTVILTNAVNSSGQNIQGFGRLRKLKDESITPQFFYFVCQDIKKHVDYHERKRVLLEARALIYKQEYTNRVL